MSNKYSDPKGTRFFYGKGALSFFVILRIVFFVESVFLYLVENFWKTITTATHSFTSSFSGLSSWSCSANPPPPSPLPEPESVSLPAFHLFCFVHPSNTCYQLREIHPPTQALGLTSFVFFLYCMSKLKGCLIFLIFLILWSFFFFDISLSFLSFNFFSAVITNTRYRVQGTQGMVFVMDVHA